MKTKDRTVAIMTANVDRTSEGNPRRALTYTATRGGDRYINFGDAHSEHFPRQSDVIKTLIDMVVQTDREAGL